MTKLDPVMTLWDTEPEVTTVDLSWADPCCKFCGHEDHNVESCPVKVKVKVKG